jgi:hypothetical protein
LNRSNDKTTQKVKEKEILIARKQEWPEVSFCN